MSFYSLFGLRVSSELELPEAPAGRGPAEVIIRFGEVPDELPEVKQKGVLYQAAPGLFRLAVRGIAKFLVRDGREILVEPESGSDEGAVRVFLLGSAMGALLQQRGVLPLHASSIEYEGNAIVFAGHSGYGKSTLAAAFHRAGRRVLADDVTAVRVDEAGVPVAYAAYPELKLWADALDKLELDAENLRKARPDIEKSCLPVGDGAATRPLPITAVYLLDTHNQDALTLEPIQGMHKLGALTCHTYRRHFLDGLGARQDHFRLCVALSRWARLARVVRPDDGFRLDELVELVEKDLADQAA